MSNSKPNWLAELQAQEQRDRDRLPAAKRALLAALRRTRAAIVTIDYDGEGDSGQITRIVAQSTAGKPVRGFVTLDLNGQPRQYDALHEALDDFAWAVLRVYHGGFENNEGGFGTLSIGVDKGTVTLDHNDRIIDVSATLTEV